MLQVKANSSFGAIHNVTIAQGSVLSFVDQANFLLLLQFPDKLHVIFCKSGITSEAFASFISKDGVLLDEICVKLDWISEKLLHVIYPGNDTVIITEDGQRHFSPAVNNLLHAEVFTSFSCTFEVALAPVSHVSFENRTCFLVLNNMGIIHVLIQNKDDKEKARITTLKSDNGYATVEETDLKWNDGSLTFTCMGNNVEITPKTALAREVVQ